MPSDIDSITSLVTAIGALGTASFGLVDATKVFGGGVSLCGLSDIERAILPLFGTAASDKKAKNDLSTPLTYGSVYANLKASWINGVALEAQKANAANLIKLGLNAKTAVCLAKATGVNADVLTELAVALDIGAVPTKEETDIMDRFETALSLILDRVYQRADQRYRNSAKALAGVISVLISVIGGAVYSSGSFQIGHLRGIDQHYWNTGNFWLAVVVGLLATPLSPIVKDVTSALAAGAAVAQKIAGK